MDKNNAINVIKTEGKWDKAHEGFMSISGKIIETITDDSLRVSFVEYENIVYFYDYIEEYVTIIGIYIKNSDDKFIYGIDKNNNILHVIYNDDTIINEYDDKDRLIYQSINNTDKSYISYDDVTNTKFCTNSDNKSYISKKSDDDEGIYYMVLYDNGTKVDVIVDFINELMFINDEVVEFDDTLYEMCDYEKDIDYKELINFHL